MYLMGIVAAQRYDVTAKARAIVADLADRSGESAFFSARRGDETICLLRIDGSFPIRSFVLYEGARFPLGVASAGLVILSHLPAAEAENYLQRVDLVDRWGPYYSREALHDRLERTRQTGYAVNPGLVVEGSFGMGAAVMSAAGRPEWALSLTGVESRFPTQRQTELGQLLLKRAHMLTNIFSGRA
jgi:DNA-binding IclR family transcriptional regulator